MRPKCHALLLDETINGGDTVRLNIFQAFMLAAMKMHWAVRVLTGGGRGPHGDPRLVLRVIQGAINYMVGLVRSRVRLARVRLGLDCRCDVSRCHVRWLGLVAFARVLRRKQAAYGPVLSALEEELRRPAYARLPHQLAEAVRRDRSSVFEEIVF